MASKRGGSRGSAEHDYSSQSSNMPSPKSSHTIARGAGVSAGQLNHPANGPGPAAKRKIGMSSEAYPSRGTPSGSAPSGMKVYREE